MLGEVTLILTLLQWLYSLGTSRTRRRKELTIRNYLEWLRRHNHTELLESIESSEEELRKVQELIDERHTELLAIGTQMFASLQNDHKEIINLIGDIKRIVEEFSDGEYVVHTFSPEAKEILEKLAAPESDGQVFKIHTTHTRALQINPGKVNQEILEGAFYLDGLEELEIIGFVKWDYGEIYRISRAGKDFMDKQEA